MRIKRSLRSGITAGMTVLAVVALGACGGSKSKKGSNPTTTPPPAGPSGGGEVDNDLVLSGALTLLGGPSTTALALAGDTYDVYCVTFEDDPAACKAAIDGEGNFNETCQDYAGKAFGCFLRKNNKTVGDIVFDQGGTADAESQLVAGAGTIKFKLNFDPELGVATAVVDTTASSALAADKVAAAKSAAKLTETRVPTLTGKYALELLGKLNDEGKVEAAPAGGGQGGGDKGEGGGIPPFIYLNEFADGAARMVSIWESEAAKNLCVTGSDTEQKPSFGATVSNYPRVPLDPTNLLKYRESMGKVIGQFAKTYPTSFSQLLSATGQQWDAKRCEEQARNAENAANTFSPQNCKIVTTGMREVKYWDPAQNKEISKWEPQWFNNWTEVAAATAPADSSIVAREQTCFNPLVGKPSEDDRFMPPCPPKWNEEHSTEATGTFTTYEVVNGDQKNPVQFLCKNPQQTDGLMFLPLSAPTTADPTYLAASITAVKAQFSSGSGAADASCEKITVAAMFDPENSIGLASVGGLGSTQVYKANRRVIIQTFSDLIRNASHGDNNECTRWTKPSDSELASWSFATKCSQDGGGSPVCWDKDMILGSIGLRVDDAQTGFADGTIDPNQPWVQPGAEKLCTGTNLGSDRPNQGESFDDFKARRALKKADCRTEFKNLSTFALQIGRLFDAALDPAKRPPSVVLQCSNDTATKDAVAALAAGSCLPEAQVDFRCEGGKDCTEVLRCWGTEDGSCVDADGTFIGRIPGRFEQTTLRAGTAGAFNMSSLTNESWSRWSEKGELVCKAARGFKIQALVKADAPFTFEGGLSSTETVSCKNEDGQAVDEDGKSKQGCGEDCGPDKMQVKFTKQ
jgi:hypothetical protein